MKSHIRANNAFPYNLCTEFWSESNGNTPRYHIVLVYNDYGGGVGWGINPIIPIIPITMLYWKSYPALACAGAYVQGLCVAMFCYVQGLCAARFFRLLNMGPYGPIWAHVGPYMRFPGNKTPFLPKKKPLREHPPARARFYIYIYIYIYPYISYYSN